MEEEFWHEAVPYPNEGEGDAGYGVDCGEIARCLWGLAGFYPEAEAVEAPGSGQPMSGRKTMRSMMRPMAPNLT
jgi:hypothetical protein